MESGPRYNKLERYIKEATPDILYEHLLNTLREKRETSAEYFAKYLRLLNKGKRPIPKEGETDEQYNKRVEAFEDKIQEQADTLSTWIGYFNSQEGRDTTYLPKRLVKIAVLALSRMGFAKVPEGEELDARVYTERSKHPLSLHPNLNQAALHHARDALKEANFDLSEDNTDDITDEEVTAFIQAYTQKENELLLTQEKDVPVVPRDPKWKTFDTANAEQLKELAVLSNNPGGWCTHNEVTARGYISDEGDAMYVLTGDTSKGDARCAYVGVRVEDNNIVEIRGRAPGQNIPLNGGLVRETVTFLEGLLDEGVVDEKSVNSWLNKLRKHDVASKLQEKLNTLLEKDESGRYIHTITKQDLKKGRIPDNQFSLILGIDPLSALGYKDNDEMKQLKDALTEVKKRILDAAQENTKVKDYLYNVRIIPQIQEKYGYDIKDLKPDEIAFSSEDVTSKTRVVLGDLKYADIPNKEQVDFSKIEVIDGGAYFYNAQNIDLSALKGIGGGTYFGDAQNIDLSALKEIGGYAYFVKVQNIGISALEVIGGGAYFYDTQNIIASQYLQTNYNVKSADEEDVRNAIDTALSKITQDNTST